MGVFTKNKCEKCGRWFIPQVISATCIDCKRKYAEEYEERYAIQCLTYTKANNE